LTFRFGLIATDPALAELYVRAYRLSFQNEPLGRDTAWLAFIVRLLERHVTGVGVARPSRESRAVQLALAYIHSRPANPLTLRDLAQVAGITPARLCRTFTAHTGLPPCAYDLRLRVESGRRLLMSALPIAEIAARTGFADQSHFGSTSSASSGSHPPGTGPHRPDQRDPRQFRSSTAASLRASSEVKVESTRRDENDMVKSGFIAIAGAAALWVALPASAEVRMERVRFTSNGDEIQGDLYSPDSVTSKKPGPAVVVTGACRSG